jgi:5-methylcytosine-specific restriction endonuclease McrBC GTP-binding regulatory subunit McrB
MSIIEAYSNWGAYNTITDVQIDSLVRKDSVKISYEDLMNGISETVKTNSNNLQGFTKELMPLFLVTFAFSLLFFIIMGRLIYSNIKNKYVLFNFILIIIILISFYLLMSYL